MIISGRQGISVNSIVKPIVEDFTLKARVSVGDCVHVFYCVDLEGRGLSLCYEAEDYDGNTRTVYYQLESIPSNLPHVEGVRWYINWRGGLVQKLHLRSFYDFGQLFFVRHEYRHIYKSQDYGRKSYLKFHDYDQKYTDLVNSKKKLRYDYGGKLTRTGKRLMYYQDMYDHYEERSYSALEKFIQKIMKKKVS